MANRSSIHISYHLGCRLLYKVLLFTEPSCVNSGNIEGRISAICLLLFGLLDVDADFLRSSTEQENPSPTVVKHELLVIFSLYKEELVLDRPTQSDIGTA